MLWTKKHRAAPDELAKALFDLYVIYPITLPKEVPIDFEPSTRTGHKVRLYQYASTILAVLAAEKKNSLLAGVRKGLENRTAHHPNLKDEMLKHAMQDLGELLVPNVEHRPLTWARLWLEDVGILEYNPARLSEFALRWMDHFIAVGNGIKQFKIVGPPSS
jgi:hypothetical protein